MAKQNNDKYDEKKLNKYLRFLGLDYLVDKDSKTKDSSVSNKKTSQTNERQKPKEENQSVSELKKGLEKENPISKTESDENIESLEQISAATEDSNDKFINKQLESNLSVQELEDKNLEEKNQPEVISNDLDSESNQNETIKHLELKNNIIDEPSASEESSTDEENVSVNDDLVENIENDAEETVNQIENDLASISNESGNEVEVPDNIEIEENENPENNAHSEIINEDENIISQESDSEESIESNQEPIEVNSVENSESMNDDLQDESSIVENSELMNEEMNDKENIENTISETVENENSEESEETLELVENNINESNNSENESSNSIIVTEDLEEIESKTEINQTFYEWLRFNQTDEDGNSLSNSDVINRFIETKPKIQIKKSDKETPQTVTQQTTDYSNITSETLAELYAQQGKYKEAIQAYKTLNLKYPEKSSFFASQIQLLEEKLENI